MPSDPLAQPGSARRPSSAPARLPSEDVIVSAPMSFTGSAQRIARLKRLARDERELSMLTAATVALTVVAWIAVFVWYAMWGLLLIPYRIMRRRARQRHVNELRHRELLESLHRSNAAPAARPERSHERIGDAERERAADALREHLIVGRLATDEFEERLSAVHRARTRGDLRRLLEDLPGTTDSTL